MKDYKLKKFKMCTKNNVYKFTKLLFSRKVIFIFTFAIICSLYFSGVYGATDPTLVTKLNSALKKIQNYLVKLATPAAGVAIASGVLIRKLSFGSEEKMIIGKKIIVNAILGYAIIISIDLIIKFIDSVL